MCKDYDKRVEKTELKDRLKDLRNNLGKTQEEIAEMAGIGRRTYQDYERGVSMPTAVNIQKLSSVFNVSSDYLLGNADLDSNGYLMALSGKSLNELTDEQKSAVKNVIETFLKQNKKE
jgi:transcriptional regulator with XRE-family HTH domain